MPILTRDMQRVVGEQRLAYVATVCADGTPSLSHKGTIRVWDNDALAFADIRSPGTVENLRYSPAIELNVVDPMVRKGYRFKGTARVVTAGDEFEQLMRFYEPQVERARERVRSFVVVRVERAQAMTSPAYDLGRTEEVVAEGWEQHYAALRAQRDARRTNNAREGLA